METRFYTREQLDRELKKARIKVTIATKLQKVGKWIDDNKELVIVLGPAVIGGAVTLAKGVGRHHRLAKEESLKNLYCYDRSLGHYWKLRRELTNAEWVAIDKRKKNGERLADILDDLRVLK